MGAILALLYKIEEEQQFKNKLRNRDQWCRIVTFYLSLTALILLVNIWQIYFGRFKKNLNSPIIMRTSSNTTNSPDEPLLLETMRRGNCAL